MGEGDWRLVSMRVRYYMVFMKFMVKFIGT